MKKFILLLVLCLSVVLVSAQPCVSNCSLYTTQSIPPNIIPSAGTAVTLSDDQVSGACPIGFTFTFYCNAYTNFYISSNGFISFNPAVSQGCCSGASIPAPGNAVNNMIAFSWNDLYPPGGGTIRYQTIGVAPNRICLITYSLIPHCCNNGPAFNSGQIKLFETSNTIEIHSGVITSDGSNATQGIMNGPGTLAAAVPGRNGQTWTATSDAYRFTVSTGGPTAPGPILGLSSLCIGASQVFSVTPMVGATQYNWTLPGGWTGASTTNTILVTPSATGVLSVTATYTCGTSTPATTLNVTVNPNPTVTISGGNTAVCPGNSITLTGNGANTYSWSNGQLINPITITPTVSGTYSVIGTSVAGCTGTATKDITVTPSPTVIITGTDQICFGQSVVLTAIGAVSYTWSNGSNNPSQSFSPTVTTTYSVEGFAGACTSSAIITVTVNPNPTVTIVGSNTACAGNPINLTANGANSYTWSTGDLTSTISPVPFGNITYTVYGDTPAGCTGFATHAVTVNASPNVTVSGPNAMCVGQTITLSALGANSYSWSNGMPSQTIVISPTTTTSYSVYGTSILGCVGPPTIKNIIVNPVPNVFIAASSQTICKGEMCTLTGNGADTYSWSTGALTPTANVTPSTTTNYTVTGTNTTTGCMMTTNIQIVVELCTGIDKVEMLSENLKVYPNPNNGEFKIEFTKSKSRLVFVYDLIGKEVYSKVSDGELIHVDIQQLNDGIYFMKIVEGNENVIIKVVKQK
ncbi:MAG: T9SS type A sorting domain-containing protein [Sphingobacteriaceae bacterium]|nr:T9SS type A sorting domain-containing protein [Sphingobacteriaceae bacterium]